MNVRALVTLTQAFTRDMVAAKPGGVIKIASTAAFEPLAGANIYAATKAFVLLFSEGLRRTRGKTAWLPAVSYKGWQSSGFPCVFWIRKAGVSAWNQWRTQHISLAPELSEMHLCEVNLSATKAMLEGGDPQ